MGIAVVMIRHVITIEDFRGTTVDDIVFVYLLIWCCIWDRAVMVLYMGLGGLR